MNSVWISIFGAPVLCFCVMIYLHYYLRIERMKKQVDHKIWNDILKLIHSNVTEVSYKTWFLPLQPIEMNPENDTFIIACTDQMRMNLLTSHYMPVLEDSVSSICGSKYKVILKLMSEDEIIDAKEEISGLTKDIVKPLPSGTLKQEFFLNPKYNFDNFIVGPNNNYAHAVCLAVAETPANVYNPVFIYGGSGLGKTHLMHAIGNFIQKKNPKMKVLYVSSEMFTSEFIDATRDAKKSNAKINALKRKYRMVDVLLIDDIQFIEGKEGTQNEFFHTFNTLYELEKQIVITSDRHPSKLTDLDDRLKSRFQWNIVADIQPPDFETRVAILRNKAEQQEVELDDVMLKIIDLIAEKVKFNIRELESALTRVIAFKVLINKNRKITVEEAKAQLPDIFDPRDVTITCETIKQTVCRKYNIKLSDMESSKRKREITRPRQIAMYLTRELTDMSLPKIGASFGGRDHTTVLHACDKITAEMKTNAALSEEIKSLLGELQ